MIILYTLSNYHEEGDTMNKTLLTILTLLSVILLGCVQLGPSQGKNEVSVSGDAEKQVAPDKAEIFFTVMTNDTSPKTAENANSEITNAAIDALKKAGVASEDIETLSYNIYPNLVWDPRTGEQTQKGYIVNNAFKVTTKDFGKIGTLLQVAVDAGVNQIQQVQFTLTKTTENEVKKEVLKEATEAARSKAEAIAEGLEARLGDLKRVQESNVYFTPYLYDRAIGVAEAKAGAVPPISPQKAVITASVTVVYEIR